jgi:hypothetical protein
MWFRTSMTVAASMTTQIRQLRPSDYRPVISVIEAGGIPVTSGYDGDGQDRVRCVKDLS